jgi:hypothetical protein
MRRVASQEAGDSSQGCPNPNPVKSRSTTVSLSNRLFHTYLGTRSVRQAWFYLVQTHGQQEGSLKGFVSSPSVVET